MAGTPVKVSSSLADAEEIPAPMTPPPKERLNGATQVVESVELDVPENPGEVVQIPSTAPVKLDSQKDKPNEIQSSEPIESAHANDAEKAPGDLIEAEHGTQVEESAPSDSGTMNSEASSSELPAFDWAELQRRYTKDIMAVNKEEDEILEQFYKYSDAFSIWAGASMNRDNERAAKRLKTREQFVRLGEASLEEKKQHYIEVVDAFKQALELLANR